MIIATAKDAAILLQPFFLSAGEERVVSAHLDAEQRLIETRDGPHGTLEEVDLPIRTILADALRLGSSALIIAHNPPSGNPSPSDADLRITRQLAATAQSLGIRLFDHLIFGRDGDCRSLRALGLL